MAYCPKCGASVYSEEIFCVNCGEKLPHDLNQRLCTNKWRFKHFIMPITILSLIIIITIAIYTIYHYKLNEAKLAYTKAEEALLLSDYQLANQYIDESIKTLPGFNQAQQIKQFTQFSVEILDQLSKTDSNQDKLRLIIQAKNDLAHFTGEAVDIFTQQLLSTQAEIQIEMVKARLAQNPSVDDLPLLLWEANSIQDPEAYQLVRRIRDQLIAHTIDQAYQYLNKNQFSQAQSIVENGLYYAPNDLKLSSLLNSIEKEKAAFIATQEERLEQAFSQYEVEQQVNQNEAIEELEIDFKVNSDDQLVVSGQLKSVATVPIHAIFVHYTLFDDELNELKSNEIYVYPETLYPGETGEFDHIHFDQELIDKTTSVQVTSITWLLQ